MRPKQMLWFSFLAIPFDLVTALYLDIDTGVTHSSSRVESRLHARQALEKLPSRRILPRTSSGGPKITTRSDTGRSRSPSPTKKQPQSTPVSDAGRSRSPLPAKKQPQSPPVSNTSSSRSPSPSKEQSLSSAGAMFGSVSSRFSTSTSSSDTQWPGTSSAAPKDANVSELITFFGGGKTKPTPLRRSKSVGSLPMSLSGSEIAESHQSQASTKKDLMRTSSLESASAYDYSRSPLSIASTGQNFLRTSSGGSSSERAVNVVATQGLSKTSPVATTSGETQPKDAQKQSGTGHNLSRTTSDQGQQPVRQSQAVRKQELPQTSTRTGASGSTTQPIQQLQPTTDKSPSRAQTRQRLAAEISAVTSGSVAEQHNLPAPADRAATGSQVNRANANRANINAPHTNGANVNEEHADRGNADRGNANGGNVNQQQRSSFRERMEEGAGRALVYAKANKKKCLAYGLGACSATMISAGTIAGMSGGRHPGLTAGSIVLPGLAVGLVAGLLPCISDVGQHAQSVGLTRSASRQAFRNDIVEPVNRLVSRLSSGSQQSNSPPTGTPLQRAGSAPPAYTTVIARPMLDTIMSVNTDVLATTTATISGHSTDGAQSSNQEANQRANQTGNQGVSETAMQKLKTGCKNTINGICQAGGSAIEKGTSGIRKLVGKPNTPQNILPVRRRSLDFPSSFSHLHRRVQHGEHRSGLPFQRRDIYLS